MNSATDAMVEWTQHAKKNAGTIMVLGVVTVIAGVLAVLMPLVSGLSVAILVGIAFIIGGVARLTAVFHARSFDRGALAFIGGALCVLVGVIMVARPGVGLSILTLVLGAYLLIDGIFGVLLAFHIRPQAGWGWLLFGAIVSGLLGVLLLAEWPLTGLWAIGTLVGISLIFTGFSWISVGSVAKKLTDTAD